MGTSTGSNSHFPSLFQNCVLWWPGSHCADYAGDYDEFPIIPTGVTVTPAGTGLLPGPYNYRRLS